MSRPASTDGVRWLRGLADLLAVEPPGSVTRQILRHPCNDRTSKAWAEPAALPRNFQGDLPTGQ